MLDYITAPVIITMGACIVSYFWGKYQVDPEEIIHHTLEM